MTFDLNLARCSLAVDAFADLLVALATSASSSVPFVFLSCVSSFTSGGSPAMHSLGAVILHQQGRSDEVGRMFGGLAVLSAIAHALSVCIFLSVFRVFPSD